MPKAIYTVEIDGTRYDLEGDHPPTEAEARAAIGKPAATPTQASASPSTPVTASSVGPGAMVGSTIGGILGGPAGAALGGAAGTGYETLIRHASEIPGALVDVAKGVIYHPRETIGGFAQGEQEGANAATTSAAVNAGLEAGGAAAVKGLASGAKAVYRGYLKPSLAGNSIAEANQIVDTALKEGIPISRGGVATANALITQLKGEVDTALAASKNTVDLHAIAEKVRDFARTNYFKPGRSPEDFEAAMRVADNIDKHPALGLPPGAQPTRVEVNPTIATDIKRGMQDAVNKGYGTEVGPRLEALKQGAYQTRVAVEQAAPAVAAKNARESDLIDAAAAIRRAVEREANQNQLVGVKTGVAALTGGEEYRRTGNLASSIAAAAALRAGLHPAIASRAAIIATRLAERFPAQAPPVLARIALAALNSSDSSQ